MIIYAGTWHLPWKTADGGRTWQPVQHGHDRRLRRDDADRRPLRTPRTCSPPPAAGIYRSADGARKWTKIRGIPSSSRRTRAFAQSPDDQNRLFAGTTEGLWMSEDGGGDLAAGHARRTWSSTRSLALPGGHRAARHRRRGRGAQRRRRPRPGRPRTPGFSERFVSRMLFDRAAAGCWPASGATAGTAASSPRPEPRGPWSRLGHGPRGPRGAVARPLGSKASWPAPTTGSSSWDAARQTWKRARTTSVDGVDVHPARQRPRRAARRHLLAATSQGLLRSLRRRRAPGSGRCSASPARSTSRRWPPPRSEPGLVVAATPLGFFRSLDGGERWAQVSSGLGDGAGAPRSRSCPGRRLASSSRRRSRRPVPLATTAGETWGRVTGGIPFADITGLAIHPDGRTIYASDFTWGGVFRSIGRRRDLGAAARARAWPATASGRWPWTRPPPDRVLAASPDRRRAPDDAGAVRRRRRGLALNLGRVTALTAARARYPRLAACGSRATPGHGGAP